MKIVAEGINGWSFQYSIEIFKRGSDYIVYKPTVLPPFQYSIEIFRINIILEYDDYELITFNILLKSS